MCHTLVSLVRSVYNFQTRNSWKLAPSKGVGIERAIKATPAGFVDTVPTVDQPWKANLQVCDVPDCSCNISSSVLSYVSFYFLYLLPFFIPSVRFICCTFCSGGHFSKHRPARDARHLQHSTPPAPRYGVQWPLFTLFLFIVSRPAELSF